MKRVMAAALILVVAATGLTGCSRERICPEDESQVRSSASPEEGVACTEDGAVPTGFETYPPGQEPTAVYVDELENS